MFKLGVKRTVVNIFQWKWFLFPRWKTRFALANSDGVFPCKHGQQQVLWPRCRSLQNWDPGRYAKTLKTLVPPIKTMTVAAQVPRRYQLVITRGWGTTTLLILKTTLLVREITSYLTLTYSFSLQIYILKIIGPVYRGVISPNIKSPFLHHSGDGSYDSFGWSNPS